MGKLSEPPPGISLPYSSHLFAAGYISGKLVVCGGTDFRPSSSSDIVGELASAQVHEACHIGAYGDGDGPGGLLWRRVGNPMANVIAASAVSVRKKAKNGTKEERMYIIGGKR